MSEMDLRQLEVFLSVAHHLHFGRAAEELYLSQPTVSQSISRLERSLGGALFVRSTRRVELTELGEMFLGEAKDALAAVGAAYDRARTFASRGSRQFWIGCAMSTAPDVVSCIPRLREAFPDLDYEVKEMRTPEQVALLVDGIIDFGLGWLPAEAPGISQRQVGQPTPMVAVVPADHPFACRESLTAAEIRREPLVASSRDANPAVYDAIHSWLHANGDGWRLGDVTRGPVALAMRVLKGDGIGLAFKLIFRNFPLSGFALVPLHDAPLLRRTALWRTNDRNPVVARMTEIISSLDLEAESGSSEPASV